MCQSIKVQIAVHCIGTSYVYSLVEIHLMKQIQRKLQSVNGIKEVCN